MRDATRAPAGHGGNATTITPPAPAARVIARWPSTEQADATCEAIHAELPGWRITHHRDRQPHTLLIVAAERQIPASVAEEVNTAVRAGIPVVLWRDGHLQPRNAAHVIRQDSAQSRIVLAPRPRRHGGGSQRVIRGEGIGPAWLAATDPEAPIPTAAEVLAPFGLTPAGTADVTIDLTAVTR